MSTLSDEQLLDISMCYTCDQIVDILEIESHELLLLLRERVEESILKFNIRPVDCETNEL
tara:strand:- start:325 stop:504 length:180 start_codon:yes stop_codon:yes gene_type:complete